MIKVLSNVLTEQQVQEVTQLLKNGEFVDGKTTAGRYAKSVKQNLQWQADGESMERVNQFVTGILAKHPDFASLCYPKYLAPFLISKSQHNGHYGQHVDDALLISDSVTRSDLSCTVFLCNPDEYEGGELCFDYHGLALSYKLNAGDVIIYPSTTLHEVKPVSKGCRTVAVSWIESYVRDVEKREILFDLDQSRQQIFAESGKSNTFDLLSKSHANLLRRWAET